MRKRYYFVLENANGKISGHAHTLLGVKHIFKKVTNANLCSVYKRFGAGYFNRPFVIYQK